MENSEIRSFKLKSLFKFAGYFSLLAMLVNLLDLALGFGSSEAATYGGKSAVEWFGIFHKNWFNGLYTLGLFNILYMLFMIPVYSGLLAAHLDRNKILASHAVILFLAGAAIYISSSAAVPMMVLSQKYAMASTEAQKLLFASAGEAALARGEDFTPGSFLGLFLSGLAAILISIIMLRGKIFGKMNAWTGIIGFTCLCVFTIIATFIPQLYLFAFYVLGTIGGVMALTWFYLTARTFFKIAKSSNMAAQSSIKESVL